MAPGEVAPEPPPPAPDDTHAAGAKAAKRHRGERGGASRRSQINYRLKKAGQATLSTPPGQGHLAPSKRNTTEQVLYQIRVQLRTMTPAELTLHLHSESFANTTGLRYGPCIHGRARPALFPPQSCPTRQLAVRMR